MATRRNLLLTTFAVFAFAFTATAQDAPAYGGIQATPNHASEFGVDLGSTFSIGDISATPSWGIGLHYRRAFDYVFSWRINASYQNYNGTAENRAITEYNSRMFEGSFDGIITVNNLKWDKPNRKWNIYALVGAGIGNLTVDLTENGVEGVDGLAKRGASAWTPFADGGVGITYRISEKMNFGIEHKVYVPFGKGADLIDGFDNGNSNITSYRDVTHFAQLKLNFNLLGKNGDKSEPLYWVNPLDVVLTDISELKARPVLDLTDTDGDGVIDMMDQEKDSPAGAGVDVRGVTMDSDNDGVADYQDQEPYSAPGFSVDGKGVAQIPTPDYATSAQVEDMIAKAIKESEGKNSLVDWFLPMIHYNFDSYSVRYQEYGNLASVANVLKSNPSIRLLVSGHTDKTASNKYNAVLSYKRAMAAIDHLVTNHGISRDRLVLQYGGEDTNIVSTSGRSLMNRRVEFKVANGGETDMGRPDGPDAGKGSFSGNKAGY